MNMDHSRSKSKGRSKSQERTERSNSKKHGADESKSRKLSYSASLSSSDGSASDRFSSRRHVPEQKFTHDAAVNEIEVLDNKTVEEESELLLERDEKPESRPLICGRCSQSFLPGQQLLFGAHKARHSRANEWRLCRHCKVPQINRKALIAHLKRRHPEKAKPSQK